MKITIYVDSSGGCQSCKTEAATAKTGFAALGLEVGGVVDRAEDPARWETEFYTPFTRSLIAQRKLGDVVLPPKPIEFRSSVSYVRTETGAITSSRLYLAYLQQAAEFGDLHGPAKKDKPCQ